MYTHHKHDGRGLGDFLKLTQHHLQHVFHFKKPTTFQLSVYDYDKV